MCMVKFWIYLGGGGGGVITKLDYFWVSFIYFFPKVKVQNWNILGDWYISNIFGVVTDIPVFFCFFFCFFFLGGGGGWEGGVNSRWRIQAYI